MRKKILFLTEATYLNTGYSTYCKEVMDRLHDSNKFEIAELASYGSIDDPRRKSIRWRNYPVVPSSSDPKEVHDLYNSNVSNQFGAWRFERACIEFKPDIVVGVRDFWMDSFVKSSPYRKCFNFCWMPTVDASPQNEEWVHYFSDANVITTYSDWAMDILNNQSNKINVACSTPPAASPLFCRVPDKRLHKQSMGINPEWKIIGTVMRNQRRKLFPELFEAFGLYLKETGDKNTYLYCHTSYPDNGWDLAKLMLKNEISSRVLMTYSCSACGTTQVSKFNDSVQQCPNCKEFASKPSSVSTGVDTATLSKIYNCFDLYCQPANSEGFGIGQVEAAACGVPVCSTDYSAMADVVRKVNGYPIRTQSLYEELETGCMRAIPDVNHLYMIFKHFFSLSDREISEESDKAVFGYNSHYSWDSTAKKWSDIFDSLPSGNWSLSSNKVNIPPLPEGMNNKEFVDWCLTTMMPEMNLVGSYEANCVLRDLNFGAFKPMPCAFFYSENSYFNRENYRTFDRNILYNMIRAKTEFKNFWEDVRVNGLKLKKENWIV